MTQEQKYEPKLDADSTSVSEMFNSILHRKIKEGAIERAIEGKVDKFIDGVADDVFRCYGDLAKIMTEKLTAAIMPSVDSIGDLPAYHDFVMKRLKIAAQNFYDEKLVSAVDAEIKEILSEVPDELNLSWFVEKLVAEAQEDESEGEITLIIEKSSCGGYWISLDKEAGKSAYACAYRLRLSEDRETKELTIFSLKCDGEDCRKGLALGPFYRFEKVLYNAYVTKSKFVLDKGEYSSNYDTEFYYD